MALKCCFFLVLLLKYSSTLNNNLPNGGQKSLLLLVQYNKILLINANNFTDRRVIVDHTKPAVAVDYYYAEGLIFFTEANNNKKEGKPEILVSRFGNTKDKPKKVITTDLKAPVGIAVDWIGRKLYWTDTVEKRIEVSELDGKNRKVLFWENLDLPRAIVVDPLRGFLYWTDWGKNAKIEKAGMDGSNRRTIVDRNLKWPNGLTLDYEQSRLYWVDGQMREIASCDLDGGNIKVHFKMEDNRISYVHPFAMTVLHQNLYVSDWGSLNVFSIEKENATKPKKLVLIEDTYNSPMHDSRAMDIKGFDPSRQPTTGERKLHPCSMNNGDCRHLCLLKPSKPFYVCACPTGIIYNDETKSCPASPEKVLLIATKDSLYKISLDTNDFALQTLPLKAPFPVVVDYDPIDRKVYWAKSKSPEVIQRASLDGSGREEVIGANVSSTDGLAIDWIARNLYWTDTSSNRILTSRLDGSSLRVLVWRDLDEPRAIAVDPIHGYLFWSDWGRTPKIERSLLDGSNRTVIESREENVAWPNGLVIDYDNKFLYYSDARLDVIQRCNFDGSNRTVIANIVRHAPHIFGFSLLDAYLYWTDWQSRSVGRVSINGRNLQVLREMDGLMGLKAVNLKTWKRAPNNLCNVGRGGCSHLCFFYPSPYPHRKCACPYDYVLADDDVTCHKAEALLIYSLRNEFRRISAARPNGDDPLDVLPFSGIAMAGPIAIEYRTRRLFWIDLDRNGIYQSLLNGSHWSSVTDLSVEKPRCLAVDWVYRNLYYGYMKPRPRIEMISIREMVASPYKRVVVHQALKEPTALAVDPMEERLYWADNMGGQKWNKVKVERSLLDGSKRENLFSRSASITDLIVDPSVSHRRLIWVEKDKIMTSDLRGANRTQIFSRKYWQIRGLDVDEHFVYFTEATTKTIYRLKKLGRRKLMIVKRLPQAASSLTMFSSSRQPGECRCCQKGCHHFCLPRRHKYDGYDSASQCGCATHYTTLNDKLTCQEPTAYVLAITSDGQVIRYVPNVAPGGPPDVMLFIPGIHKVRSFVVVPEDRHLLIFYVDSEKATIRKIKTKSESVADLVSNRLHAESNKHSSMRRNRINSFKRNSRNRRPKHNTSSPHILAPYELAYDPVNQYLFWTDTHNHVINVTSIHKDDPKGPVIHLGARVPKSIAIDSVYGHIYWVSTNVNGSHPRIERAELDGANQQIIVADSLGSPENLLIHDRFLYWIDSKNQYLERWDTINRKRTKLLHGHKNTMGSPSGLVALKGYLYWYSKEVLWKMKADAAENAFVNQYRLEGYGNVVDIASVGDSDNNVVDDESALSLKSVVKEAQNFCPQCQSLCIPVRNKENERFRCGCTFGYYIVDRVRCLQRQNCPIGQFHCGNTKDCVPVAWRCDGSADCPNKFDEENCPYCEGKHQFLCGNGDCIPMSKRCDKTHDCDNDERCCPIDHCVNDKCIKVANPDPKCADHLNTKGYGTRIPKEQVLEGDVSSRTTYTVAVVVAVLAVVLTCGIAGYTCTRRGRHVQDPNAPYVMHTDQLDIMLVPNGPLFSQAPSTGDSDLRPSSHSRLGPSGSTGCPSSGPSPSVPPPPPSVPSLPASKRRGTRTPQPDVISFYERDRLTGASRSDTDAPDFACPLNPPPSPITEVGTRGRARVKGRSRKRRHRSGGGGTGGRHHRRYHNVRLVIYTDAPPPTPRTCLSSAEEAGPGSNSPQSSRRSYNYNRPFPPPPSPENSSD